MQKHNLKIGNMNIKYLDEGDRSQPCFLMIHGFPESSLIWRRTIQTVCDEGFRALAPDLPGFGGSDRFEGESVWESYVQFISDFLAALEVEEVHLFVHDWGGLIGLRWAMDNLQRVKSIVISNTTISVSYTWHELAQKFRTAEVGEKVMKLMSNPGVWNKRFSSLIPGLNDDQELLKDFYRVFSTEENHKTALELYRSGDTDKLLPYVGRLVDYKGPVSIVWGEDDPYIHVSHATQLRDQYIPNAVVHVLPSVGHFIHLEAPEELNKIVEEHIRKVLND